MNPITPARKQGTSLFRLVVTLIAIVSLLYLVCAAVFYPQVQGNYGKWVSKNIRKYSISVGSMKVATDNIFLQTQSVADGKITNGYDEFGEPVIDWAFDHAKFCSLMWIFCSALHWSFQYDPVYGFPSRFEFDDNDGHYTLIVRNIVL